ncbi:alpha/beta hydrolase [Levilactobacillus acidifarinae]|uniref:Cell surface hydrolase n=1 Tax=Levilactobacillus acidifarinae DSM 19394 = JCM 15949 TaxID=1423715 RepID=A0A0R1LND5_9LACO|nr:alpha/beta hydrolase [Levilactobacillus acidifarinae]KRK94305.1 hypothetical protein FD25_GL000263 [Levilactobacillus acidifarinae DSM 19394]GEO69951.1 alpha/beta hydrolase [Levilactobacillus acidifarinae]
MTKTIRRWIIGIILALVVILGGIGVWRQQRAQQYRQAMTPTFFFHGGGSSYHAEEHMVNAAKRAGVTTTVIRAMVDRQGHVRLVGQIPRSARNPIVEVNYANNAELDYVKHGQWATNVVRAVAQRYPFKTMNMVGHSLGNISLIYYSLQNDQNVKMPKLVKQVDIAGHFAGLNFSRVPAAIRQPAGLKLAPNGKPNRMNATYRQMTQLRHTLPTNQLRVLNLYGNIGGHTDGTVPNVSSLALKYLVADREKSYTEKQFTGQLARHSKLHSNPQVDRTMIQFLWGK